MERCPNTFLRLVKRLVCESDNLHIRQAFCDLALDLNDITKHISAEYFATHIETYCKPAEAYCKAQFDESLVLSEKKNNGLRGAVVTDTFLFLST
jgi:hypothetical protein